MNIKNTLKADAKKQGKRLASNRPEDERLSIGSSFAYGFQHVLSMYGGIIAVPLIVGQAAGLSPADIGILIAAALFMGGLATLLQTIGIPFFGSQLPLVQGVSFASVATMVATLAKETPCTRGSWEPKNGMPMVCSSVASPPMKRAAAIRMPISAGERPAAWPTISGTAMMPPYMERTCWKP